MMNKAVPTENRTNPIVSSTIDQIEKISVKYTINNNIVGKRIGTRRRAVRGLC
jgi:hypothetical protein